MDFYDGSPSFSPDTIDTIEFSLIGLVKSFPELYNPLDESYLDKRRKDSAWTSIAKKLKKDERWCVMKWRNLVEYYKDRRKVYQNGFVRHKKWVYYEALDFLSDICNKEEIGGSGLVGLNPSDYELSSESNKSRDSFHRGNRYNLRRHLVELDDTQYQSLDGIAEREAEGRNANICAIDHEIDSEKMPQSCPPSKKRKEVATESNQNSGQCSNIVASHNVHPSAKRLSNINTGGANHLRNQSELIVTPTNVNINANEDCPHYHFCMSLAARFRRMDDSSAIRMQMKILELFLKT